MIPLPQNGQWVQTNRSDIFGSLQGSFNLDLTKILGKTRVTRLMTNISTPSLATLISYPVGFKILGSSIYTVAGTSGVSAGVFKTGSNAQPNSPFTLDATAGTPSGADSTLSDIEVFNENIYVTSSLSRLNKYNGATWGFVTMNATSDAGPWMMCVYGARLYITSNTGTGSKIYSTPDGTTIATTGSYTIDLGFLDQKITFIRAAQNRIWFGTTNINNGIGYVYEWDGVSTQPTRFYTLESTGALACVIKNDTPYVTDAQGRILKFSNGTFIEVARLPVFDKILATSGDAFNTRFIHPNGMCLLNGRVSLNINNLRADGGISEFCPSGIWELDEAVYNPYTGTSNGVGLYHKYSFSYTPTGTNTITDYGQNRIAGVGAIAEIKIPTNVSTSSNGSLLAGASIYSDASTVISGIYFNDTLTSLTGSNLGTQCGGYLVSNKILATDPKGFPSVQNMWGNVYTLYRKLLSVTDKIIVKYRIADNDPTEITLTWTSPNTFTTTTNILGLEKYEVEVIQGTGSGFCSQITTIDNNNTFYTVHLDQNYSGVTGTAKARIQNWKWLSSVPSIDTYDGTLVNTPSNWIQLKVFMLLMNRDELERILVVNENYNPAN